MAIGLQVSLMQVPEKMQSKIVRQAKTLRGKHNRALQLYPACHRCRA